jgi:hypothetical protein
MNGKILSIVAVLSSTTLADQMPEVTKLVIRFIAADLPADTSATKPKTLYVPGNRYARVEQETDPSSHAANLIIVNEPNIWAIDSADKIGNHSTNPGPDFTVHNPIFGSDGPAELCSTFFDILEIRQGRDRQRKRAVNYCSNSSRAIPYTVLPKNSQ